MNPAPNPNNSPDATPDAAPEALAAARVAEPAASQSAALSSAPAQPSAQAQVLQFDDVVSGAFDAEQELDLPLPSKRVLAPQVESPKLHKVLGVEMPNFD